MTAHELGTIFALGIAGFIIVAVVLIDFFQGYYALTKRVVQLSEEVETLKKAQLDGRLTDVEGAIGDLQQRTEQQDKVFFVGSDVV